MRVRIKAKPNSRKESIRKIDSEYFEVRVCAHPEKGRANLRIIEILSEHFNISKSKIHIIRGGASKEKIFELDT